MKLLLIIRIFTKRVYLPLLPIYLVNVVGLSLTELGVLVAVMGLVTLLVETPTGYFSDHVSRRLSFTVGGVLGTLGMIVLVTLQSEAGAYLGLLLETLAYAFFSGTAEAITHDSLSVLGRGDEYSRFSSRIQSISLVVNAVLITLIPLTYAIDERLPFVFGALQFLILLTVSIFLKEVRHYEAHDVNQPINFKWLRDNKPFLLFAAVFGVMAAIYTAPSDFRNIALEAFGLAPALLGLMFAAASLAGATLGFVVHRLKQLGIGKYVALDGLVAALGLAAFATGNLVVAIGAFIVNMSFWRYRQIIYQDHIFSKYKTRHKATLLSITRNASQLNRIWQPAAIGVIIGLYGLQTSFAIMAGFAVLVAVPFVLVSRKVLG